MALVVEDGTGVDGANTYQLAATCAAYAISVGKVFNIGDAAKAEADLIAAAKRLDMDYEDELASPRRYTTQALAFPREGFRDKRGIWHAGGDMPTPWINAQAELAIRANGGEDLFGDRTNRRVTALTHSTDMVTKEMRFARTASDKDGKALTTFPIVRDLIKHLLYGRSFARA